MLYQPMSSPQITRMLGLAASCAAVGGTPATIVTIATAIAASSIRLDKGFIYVLPPWIEPRYREELRAGCGSRSTIRRPALTWSVAVRALRVSMIVGVDVGACP